MQLRTDSALFSVLIIEAIVFKPVLQTKGNHKFNHSSESIIFLLENKVSLEFKVFYALIFL